MSGFSFSQFKKSRSLANKDIFIKPNWFILKKKSYRNWERISEEHFVGWERVNEVKLTCNVSQKISSYMVKLHP